MSEVTPAARPSRAAAIAGVAERLRMVRQAQERFLGRAAIECILDHTILPPLPPDASTDLTPGANPQFSDRSTVYWGGANDDE